VVRRLLIITNESEMNKRIETQKSGQTTGVTHRL